MNTPTADKSIPLHDRTLEERRRWTRRPVRPEKVYSELDPVALQAAVDMAERMNRGHILSPAVSCAIKEYLRVSAGRGAGVTP